MLDSREIIEVDIETPVRFVVLWMLFYTNNTQAL